MDLLIVKFSLLIVKFKNSFIFGLIIIIFVRRVLCLVVRRKSVLIEVATIQYLNKLLDNHIQYNNMNA